MDGEPLWAKGSSISYGNAPSLQKRRRLPNDNRPLIMTTTAQTTFRNMAPSDALAARIQMEAEKLDQFFDRITSCRVIVEAPHGHHRHGEAFHVHIKLGVPGKELVVAREPEVWTAARHENSAPHNEREIEAPHEDVYVAVRDSFEAMRRQLKDYVHCLRGAVKRR